MKPILQVFSFDVVGKLAMGLGGVLLIRFMAEGEYARYTFALAVVAMVAQTLVSGFNRIYIVGYQTLGLAGGAASFLGLQLLGIGALVLLTIPVMELARGTYWFVVALVITTCLSEFPKTFFQQELRFLHFSLIELARVLVFVASLLVLIVLLRDRLQAWQVLLTQSAALAAVFFVCFRKHLDLARLLQVREAARLAFAIVRGEYRWLFGYFFVLALFAQVDVFMLRAMTNDRALAAYGSAFRYYGLLLMALSNVQVVLVPVIQGAQSVAQMEEAFTRHRELVWLFAPLVFLGAVSAQWLMPWIDRGKYPEAVLIFRILAASAVLSFAFSPHVNVIMRFEEFRFLFVLVCLALLIVVALNLVLVPPLAGVGAAIATLIAFACINGPVFVKARRLMRAMAPLLECEA